MNSTNTQRDLEQYKHTERCGSQLSSPVASLCVEAHAAIVARVSGIGGAALVEVLAGGAAAHRLGLHGDRHQGHAAAVEHAGLVGEADLAGAAAARATRRPGCLHQYRPLRGQANNHGVNNGTITGPAFGVDF